MCLDSVTKKYNNDKSTGYGWKVVITDNKKFNFYSFPFYKDQLFNRWLNREGNPRAISLGNYNTYENGFHVFKTRKDARNYRQGLHFSLTKVVKVKYKEIICEGKQANILDPIIKPNCLVVKQILVIKPEK